MKGYKSILGKIIKHLIPKFYIVVVIENGKMESNAVAIANYIKSNFKLPVFFITSKKFKKFSKSLLLADIKVISLTSIFTNIVRFTGKYIFSTHGMYLNHCSKNQIAVNVWHGVGHKKIRKGRGEEGIQADITVATSELSRKMFAEFFGVPLKQVFISGYPRNDIMLRTSLDEHLVKEKINLKSGDYKNIIFWMPTFRRESHDAPIGWGDGLKLNNPFEIDNFDISSFNDLLVEHNTICLLKPHYFYLNNNDYPAFSNILMIDDEWICSRGITLYHLLASTDILISDFSSVIIDFTLLNRPIVCFCTDIEEYKKTQGLYFEDIENWLPSRLIQTQQEFRGFLSSILEGSDPDIEKRKKIRDIFFKYQDSNSTKRLVEHVFSYKK